MSANVYPLRQDDSPEDDLPSIADILPPSLLSEQAQQLVDYATRRGGRLPKSLSKSTVKDNFDKCFEMIGGLPRLAIWADQNPSAFFTHYAKLLPAQQRFELSLPPVDWSDPSTIPTAELKRLLLSRLASLPDDDLPQQD